MDVDITKWLKICFTIMNSWVLSHCMLCLTSRLQINPNLSSETEKTENIWKTVSEIQRIALITNCYDSL